MDYKPTVVFDFDGVIHSYTSGWKGVAEIPDPPVPGIGEAIAELRQLGYRAVVVSTRCSTAEGMGAVRRYLRDNGIEVDSVQMDLTDIPKRWWKRSEISERGSRPPRETTLRSKGSGPAKPSPTKRETGKRSKDASTAGGATMRSSRPALGTSPPPSSNWTTEGL